MTLIEEVAQEALDNLLLLSKPKQLYERGTRAMDAEERVLADVINETILTILRDISRVMFKLSIPCSC